jgi:Fungal specific transcription factor domain
VRETVQLREEMAYNSDAEVAVESLLNLSGSRSVPRTPLGESDEIREKLVSHAPVPKLARLLRDGSGKFIFVGDSSNLAFLQNIRRLAKARIGECALTTDPLRHAIVEATPIKPVASPAPDVDIRPSLQEAKELVSQYLLASSGVIDLFDPEDITAHLMTWISDPSAETDFNSSIYYLVLAIGAQVKYLTEKTDVAELYFSRGRQLVVENFMDDPSVLTIQSYALITLYMLTACRRNGAFMLLGIAIRAAYALGLHRSDVSALFEKRERRSRERVWKSLRVLDLFMSSSLGRPPATSEVDGGNVSWKRPSRDYNDIQMEGLNSSAMLRICFIFERILNEVYCRREVSVQLVESISQQYRDWTLELPAGLRIDGLDQTAESANASLQKTIGLAHLRGAYYWSIILLTRPFLIFAVSSRQNSAGRPDVQSPVQTFADSCVEAALRGIEIATDLVHTPGIPQKLPLFVNSVFVSALVFGVASFGDFDKSFPLMSSLDQAEMILTSFAKYDPSARRYVQITQHLHQAALDYIKLRDQKQMDKRRQDVYGIFGNLLAGDFSSQTSQNQDQGNAPLTPGSPTPGPTDPTSSSAPQSVARGPLNDQSSFTHGPTLTTSGVLATADPGSEAFFQGYHGIGTMANDFLEAGFSPYDSSIPSIPSYAEELPLFSLLSDLEPLPGQFPSGSS